MLYLARDVQNVQMARGNVSTLGATERRSQRNEWKERQRLPGEGGSGGWMQGYSPPPATLHALNQ